MKKHQLAAMVLSALSAGILISCTKPAQDTPAQNSTDNESNTTTQQQADDSSTNTNKAEEKDSGSKTPIQAIVMTPEVTNSYLTTVANEQILPAYKNVAEQSKQLNELAEKYCASGSVSADNLALLRKQWLVLAKAWASAEMVNFGPAMQSMSNLYINYFPDERGLVHQGVLDLIEANPKLTPEQLGSESAIVQGIPGLEEVLYANDALDAGQCQYVISASSALSQRLISVQKAWEQSATTLLGVEETAGNLGMNRWINSLLSLIETTKSSAIDKPLGLTGHKKGHLPAHTAGQSREIINAKVAVLNTALTDAHLVTILAENDQDTLADELSTILADISTLLAQMPEDIAQATPEQQQQLYDKLTKLTRMIKRELMPVLGVQVGFNSTDGD